MRTKIIETPDQTVVLRGQSRRDSVTQAEHYVRLTSIHPKLKTLDLTSSKEGENRLTDAPAWAYMVQVTEFLKLSPQIQSATGKFSVKSGQFSDEDLLAAFESYLDTDLGEPDSLWAQVGRGIEAFRQPDRVLEKQSQE